MWELRFLGHLLESAFRGLNEERTCKSTETPQKPSGSTLKSQACLIPWLHCHRLPLHSRMTKAVTGGELAPQINWCWTTSTAHLFHPQTCFGGDSQQHVASASPGGAWPAWQDHQAEELHSLPDIYQEALHAEQVRKGPLSHTPLYHRHTGTSCQKKEHCFREEVYSPGHCHVSNSAFRHFQTTSAVYTILE